MMASAKPVSGRVPATAASIRHAAEMCRAGELVILPTETVYGVAVRADSPAALAHLCAAKGREAAKQLTRMAGDLDAIRQAGATVDDTTQRLAAAFWPGPLTMVLPDGVGGWLGFRVPDHPVALAWLRELSFLPAVTSANRSGTPPTLTAQAAWAALTPHVALALDDGPSPGGQASTVVRVGQGAVQILRDGPISREDIAAAARLPVQLATGEKNTPNQRERND
ncbi:MAG: L-threonylcarbamoyladenylate synthase [Kiritimatiellia bacterium]|nr:L-threonylcarbamoyladenylate synthase [Kiritimatiellia bacterium]